MKHNTKNARPKNSNMTITLPKGMKSTIATKKETIMKKKQTSKKSSVKQTVAAKKEIPEKKKNTAKKSVKQVVNKKFHPVISKALTEKLQQMFFDQKNGEIKRSKWSEAVEKAGVTQKELWQTADHFGLINHRS
jgi:hypothetical protein